jgi:hypothetical protein
MNYDLFIEKFISDATCKTISSLSSITYNNNVWFCSGSSEKQYVELYVESNNNWTKFSTIQEDINGFGGNNHFLIKNNKLYLLISTGKCIYFYQYLDDKWTQSESDTCSVNDNIISFEVYVLCEEHILFIETDESVFVVGKDKKVIKTFEKNSNFNFKAKLLDVNGDKKLIFIYCENKSIHILTTQDLENWIEMKNIDCDKIEAFDVDICLNQVTIALSRVNKINIYSYSLENDDWINESNYEYKKETSVRQFFVKYDLNGKLWLVVNDAENNILVHELYQQNIQLYYHKHMKTKNFMHVGLSQDGQISIILEKLLNTYTNSLSKLINTKLISNIISKRHGNYMNEIDQFFDFFIEIDNYENNELLMGAEYIKWVLESLKTLIEDNVDNLDSYIEKHTINEKITNILEDVVNNNTLLEKRFLMIKSNYSIIKYDSCEKFLCDLFIKNGEIFNIIKENENIEMKKILDIDLSKNTIIKNESQLPINVFYCNKNISLGRHNSLDLKTNSIARYCANNDSNNCDIITTDTIPLLYKSNLLVFGYVYDDDLDMFPINKYQIDQSKKYTFVCRYRNNNYMPYIDNKVYAGNINNFNICITYKPRVHEKGFIFDKIFNSDFDVQKDFFYVDYNSNYKDDVEIIWKNDKNECAYNMYSVNNIFVNNSGTDIDVKVLFFESYEDKSFLLKENTILLIKNCDKNIIIKNIFLEHFYDEKDIINLFESY